VRLRQLQRELGVPVELVHRAFILRGEEQERTFTEYHLRHRSAARELTGLAFDLPQVGDRYPRSSFPALEAAEWVKQQHPDRFAAFDLALYEAFFQDTRDISDPSVLGSLVEELSLDRTALEQALRTGQFRGAILREYDEALQRGITSIPTVLIGSTSISGAVPYEEYRQAVHRVLSSR
jgi:predicted DsbA family dithiol-disulfide isomerase